jgi:hypothetical protein
MGGVFFVAIALFILLNKPHLPFPCEKVSGEFVFGLNL